VIDTKGFGRKRLWPHCNTVQVLPRGTEDNHENLSAGGSCPAEVRSRHIQSKTVTAMPTCLMKCLLLEREREAGGGIITSVCVFVLNC